MYNYLGQVAVDPKDNPEGIIAELKVKGGPHDLARLVAALKNNTDYISQDGKTKFSAAMLRQRFAKWLPQLESALPWVEKLPLPEPLRNVWVLGGAGALILGGAYFALRKK